MKMRSFGAIVAVLLFTGACTSTFMVSKDGKGYFLGSNSRAVHAMLCESGDLGKILSGTQLPQDMKDDLLRFNCSAEKSGEKVKQLYATMTPTQRKDLRLSFKNNGYDVNAMRC